MKKDGLEQLQEEELDKAKREKHKKNMPVSGKSVFGLKKIIEKKGQSSPPEDHKRLSHESPHE